MRDSASLSPSRRLGNLSILEQVILPAEQMLRESGTTLRHVVLPDAGHPPIGHLPLESARRLADEPQEAARYYRCYRVESWDRDLATSSYLTAGTDQRTLYLEWTHSVLSPIRAEFRAIDRHPDSGPGRRAFEAVVTLPVTIPARLVGLFRGFRALPYGADEIEPGRYGAGPSLRELAASREPETFFQEADAVRYIQVVEQAFFTAIGTFLQERHYSIADVLGAAKERISNTITIENGTFVNSAISNQRARQTVGASPSSADRGAEMKSNKITVSGGTFTGSAVSNEHAEVHTGTVSQVTVGDLRAALRDHRDQIVALGRDDDERRRVAGRIEQVVEELEAPEPDADVVRGGWKSVLKVLDVGARTAESITKITDLVTALFGA